MEKYLVELKNISKSFFSVRALSDVSFNLKKGEVHALVGENGAGKSTLMKILTGIYSKDEGRIFINGSEVSIDNVIDSMGLGIQMIHQELNLIEDLTVAQNIFIGRESEFGPSFFLNDKIINEKARELCATMGINVEPNVLANNLSVAQQQMVEIVKAVSSDAEIIIMDEPTASLTLEEIDELFEIIRKLKEQGKGIIYISHRLEELFVIAERVSVMRDGEMIDTLAIDELTEDIVIQKMVGREITVEPPVFDPNQFGELALEVKNLSSGHMVKDVSFHVSYGEIVGFAGLVGAGRSETMKAIFGAYKKDSGQIKINGQIEEIKQPSDAVDLKIAYLSEDRKTEGGLISQPIFENISLPKMSKFVNHKIILNTRKELTNAEEMSELLGVKSASSRQLLRYLSGGNQQKVLIAKWLSSDSEIIIFDEPTRGIDVGAKDQIYDLVKKLANEGNAVIVISSEMQEIIRLCNRVYVMSEGRITGELNTKDITQEKIMTLAINRTGK